MSNTNNAHTPDTTSDCDYCQDRLEEAALSLLEPDDYDAFESHLARCPDCQRDLEDMKRVVNLLPYACDEAEPSADIFARIESRLQQEPAQPLQPLASPAARSPLARPWFTAIAAAAIVLAVLSLFNFWPGDSGDSNLTGSNVQVMAMARDCDGEDCDEDTGGHIGADLETQDGVVIAWNLNPEDKHEVWCLKRDGSRVLVSSLTVGSNGSVVQTVQFPEAVGSYDQIYVVRQDGTRELSVEPKATTEAEAIPTEPETTDD